MQARLAKLDLDAYYAASLTPALEFQWGLLEVENAPHVLSLIALFTENERVPTARLALLTGLRDESDGIRTPLADALSDAQATSLLETLEDERVRLHPMVRDFVRHTKIENPSSLASGAVEKLLTAFRDIATFENQCAQRGIDAAEKERKERDQDE